MKQLIKNNLKHIRGWRTNRKIVVISVDDYGNVRVGSKQARENMDKAGLKVHSRFDAYDALETREDLEHLFEVLHSVKDRHNKPAVFTPFALPCNINFEAMQADNYKSYSYELLPETYQKLSEQQPKAYQGTWQLWQQGIEEGLLRPQFHGREHFNVKVFNSLLESQNKTLLTSLANRSNVSISDTGFSEIKYTAAFAFQKPDELNDLKVIATDGVKTFEQVFGYQPIHFMAPTANVHDEIIKDLNNEGIKAFDRGKSHKNHIGNGVYKTSYHYTGKIVNEDQLTLVRNVVFEPTSNKNAVDMAIKQIEAAFRWKAPAIISSHRVNFCGHIDPKNREKGLSDLKLLLHKIVKKWPEVEFMSSEELIKLIRAKKRLD